MSNKDGVLSHRALVLDSFTVPVSTFYTLLEELLAARAIPGAKVSRVLFPEGGLGGANREYLRVRRGPLVYDISGAVFGESFMVTWWLRKLPSRTWIKWLVGFILVVSLLDPSNPIYAAVVNTLGCLLVPVGLIGICYFWIGKIPVAGGCLWGVIKWGWQAIRLPTLFQLDTSATFQSIVPSVVEHAIKILRSAQGVRRAGIPEPEALPPVQGA